MKPPRFEYAAAESVEHALVLLSEHGDEAKVLAGGQSLGPLLNLRMASPSILIDINTVTDLAWHCGEVDGSLAIGALTRHRVLETSGCVRESSPLLREAAPFIGHRTIRNRGTIGGSLVHADPAAELPAVAVALDATMVLVCRGGERRVAAGEFFLHYYTCDVTPTELLTQVVFPPSPPRCGTSWVEFAPRHGDYGYVGVAAVVTLNARDRCANARVVYSGIGPIPQPALAARQLTNMSLDEGTIEACARQASRELEPSGDTGAPVEYKRSLMIHLTQQALTTAHDRAREAQ